jgi:hypothetical protein
MRWAAALLLLLVAVTGAAEVPVVQTVDDTLVLTSIPALLHHEQIRPELVSGLTNSFIFHVTSVDLIGDEVSGVARIDIRYEPWDEAFLLTVITMDSSEESVAESFEALAEWWQELQVAVLSAAPLELDLSAEVEVDLSFVPFSQSEQMDAQLWFSKSLGSSVGTAAGNQGSGVLNVLVATSITRRSLLRFEWTVPATPVTLETEGESPDG